MDTKHRKGLKVEIPLFHSISPQYMKCTVCVHLLHYELCWSHRVLLWQMGTNQQKASADPSDTARSLKAALHFHHLCAGCSALHDLTLNGYDAPSAGPSPGKYISIKSYTQVSSQWNICARANLAPQQCRCAKLNVVTCSEWGMFGKTTKQNNQKTTSSIKTSSWPWPWS